VVAGDARHAARRAEARDVTSGAVQAPEGTEDQAVFALAQQAGAEEALMVQCPVCLGFLRLIAVGALMALVITAIQFQLMFGTWRFWEDE